jgi:hypothetical protein
MREIARTGKIVCHLSGREMHSASQLLPIASPATAARCLSNACRDF